MNPHFRDAAATAIGISSKDPVAAGTWLLVPGRASSGGMHRWIANS